MRERVNPETGKPFCIITNPDQEAIARVRELVRRLFLGRPAEIVYEVQDVTVADADGEYADWAEQADNLLQHIGWPKEKAETKATKEGAKP